MSIDTVRQYQKGEIAVRIRGLDGEGPVRVHIEHKSGAALIVPTCDKVQVEGGFRLATRGFDGTSFTLEIDDRAGTVRVEASAAAPFLGGEKSAVLDRGEDIVPAAGAQRATGDEPTMPIIVRDKG